MNKTVTINLANTVFHIDEGAYEALRAYLESIRKSFERTEGRDEILADIEARIAELFSDRMVTERQVITQKDVDDIIVIMGQPEDYHVDVDVFEDEDSEGNPSEGETVEKRKNRKLYRDMDNNYIGGVSQGLSYYLGIDAIWVRVLFVLLTLFGNGFGVLVYLVLWILVPEARTTAEKLDMKGEPVNISNIEKKVKEGFDSVADSVKNVDYQKMGDSVKGGSQRFFGGLAEVLTFLFQLVAKLIGLVLVITGGATLIALFLSLFSLGMLEWVDFPGIEWWELFESTDLPMWVLASLSFLALGIPFYLMMYLGLRLLISTLKSMGWAAKIILIVVWLAATSALVVIGAQQSAEYAIRERVVSRENLGVMQENDTLFVDFSSTDELKWDRSISLGGFRVVEDEEDHTFFLSDDVRMDILASPSDSLDLQIDRRARGARRSDARRRAEGIEFNYRLKQGVLSLDGYFITDSEHKLRDQSMGLKLYVPQGTILVLKGNIYKHLGWQTDMSPSKTRFHFGQHIWQMGADGVLNCKDCEEEEPMDSGADPTEENDVPLVEEVSAYNILDKYYECLWC